MIQHEHDHDSSVTTWKNPTTVEVRVSLHRDKGTRPILFVVPAGAERQLSGEFDTAIHDVRNGVIIGGHAPQLVDKAHPERILHSSLRSGSAPVSSALEEALAGERAKTAALEEELTRLRAGSQQGRNGARAGQ